MLRRDFFKILAAAPVAAASIPAALAKPAPAVRRVQPPRFCSDGPWGQGGGSLRVNEVDKNFYDLHLRLQSIEGDKGVDWKYIVEDI
jgi:hypothetical protein